MKKLMLCLGSIALFVGLSSNYNKVQEEPVLKVNTGNSVIDKLSTDMVKVAGGTFMMGAKSNDSRAVLSEKPQHSVTVDDFYISKYEVTQELWEAVMGNNPSMFKGAKLPVDNVSWNDCQEFIAKLNKKTGLNFRLPTEAEWEYAARGGKESKNYNFSGSNNIGSIGWFYSNSNDKTHMVGTKAANELGLYDMTGNVWEWCQDWFDAEYYKNSPSKNPMGPKNGTDKVARGGSWDRYDRYSRLSYREVFLPDERFENLGFRLAL